MMIMHDDSINHSMNGDEACNHGMTWHGDCTKRGKNGVFGGEK